MTDHKAIAESLDKAIGIHNKMKGNPKMRYDTMVQGDQTVAAYQHAVENAKGETQVAMNDLYMPKVVLNDGKVADGSEVGVTDLKDHLFKTLMPQMRILRELSEVLYAFPHLSLPSLRTMAGDLQDRTQLVMDNIQKVGFGQVPESNNGAVTVPVLKKGSFLGDDVGDAAVSAPGYVPGLGLDLGKQDLTTNVSSAFGGGGLMEDLSNVLSAGGAKKTPRRRRKKGKKGKKSKSGAKSGSRKRKPKRRSHSKSKSKNRSRSM